MMYCATCHAPRAGAWVPPPPAPPLWATVRELAWPGEVHDIGAPGEPGFKNGWGPLGAAYAARQLTPDSEK